MKTNSPSSSAFIQLHDIIAWLVCTAILLNSPLAIGQEQADKPKQIGAKLEAVDDAIAKRLGLPATMGSVVSMSIKGSPAEKAGLKKMTSS